MVTETRSRESMGRETDELWSIVDYLNIYSYDTESQCYALADGSIGTVIESAPIACTTSSNDELQEIAESIALGLSSLRENITGQIILVPSIDISHELERYSAYGGTDHPVLGSIEKKKLEFFEQMRTKPVFERGDCPYKVKRFRVLIVLYMRPDEKVGGVMRSLKDAVNLSGNSTDEASGLKLTPEEMRFYKYKEHLTRFISQARKRLIGTLTRKTPHVSIVGPDTLMAAFRTLMYPKSVAKTRHSYDPHRPLSEQIPLGGITVDAKNGEIHSDDVVYRVLSYSQPAEQSWPGRLSMPARELNFLSFLDYISYGFVSINFVVLDKDYMRRFVAQSKAFVNGGMCREARKPVLLADLDRADHYLENEKRRFFDVGMAICVFAEDGKTAKNEVESLRDKLIEIGVDSRIETHVAPSIWLQALPFGFGPTLPEAKRTFLVPDRVIADMAPLYAFSRGNTIGRNGIPFLVQNRTGELFNLDLFAPISPHFVLVGASGSGKSFFTNNLVADFLRDPDAQTFFIDKGRSYATLTTMMGDRGSYNNMGLSQKTCINAFAGTYTQAGSFLKALLMHLACPDPNDGLSAEQQGKLDQYLVQTYKERQLQASYRSYKDLKKQYPDMWVESAVKRFSIGYLDPVTLANVRSLGHSEDESDGPPFRIYYVSALFGRQVFDDDKKRLSMERFPSVSRLPEDVSKYLTSRDFRIEEQVDEDGSTYVVLLYENEQAEQNLQMDKFDFVRRTDHLVLEVGQDAVFEMLIDNDVQVLMDDTFFEKWEDHFTAEVKGDARYAKRVDELHSPDPSIKAEAEAVIKDLVDERVSNLPIMEVFYAVEGQAVLQQEVFMRHFIATLTETRDPDCEAIAQRLAPYTGDGNYAGFFDGRTGFQLRGKKIVTFELQELASAGDHLLAAVVGSLLQMLILYGQDDDVRTHRKKIVMDEFWQLLANDMVATSVVNLYRTARKFNTSVGVITQVVTDLTNSDAGRSIIANAPTRILMRQPKDICAKLDTLLEFTPVEQAVMTTVTTESGFYSEAFVSVPDLGISDVCRLVSTPYFYWIATTKAEDVKQRERQRKEFKAQGMSDEEALDAALSYCSERWPSGVVNGEVKR